MKHLLAGAVIAVVIGAFPNATNAGEIKPGLDTVLGQSGETDIVSALVYLKDSVNIKALNEQLKLTRANRQARHEIVVTSLQERALATQFALLNELNTLADKGDVELFEAYWIADCVRVDARPAIIKQIAARPDVEGVYFNYPIELIQPEAPDPIQKTSGNRSRAPELGVQAVRAPEVWAMGFTGDGILVSTLDTGVDGNHPALASRWRGVADSRYIGHPEWALFDPVTGWTFPQDSAYHGTHTMGTVCGGPPGNEVGVAPGAQWIHAAVIDRVGLSETCADAIAAFQWLVDPDGDPVTSWDVPNVCSNSWGIGSWHNVPPYNNPCDESFWSYLDACEAAGTVILFSAGNEGSGANTLRRPADRATDDYHTCAVGGIDANNPPNWTIYTSSSRGPTYCTPSGDAAIKPEVAAPAVDVISSMPGNDYGPLTGTSMASPHVNGVVALMLEACPDLTVEEVKQILYDTAFDLGDPGKDNDFGYGLVDAYEAVNLALTMCSGAPRAHDSFHETLFETPVQIALDATDYDGLPDPPGALTYIVTSLPDPSHTLTDDGNGHVITSGDLPYSLVNHGNLVTFTPAGAYYGTDIFEFKANDGGVPPDGGDSDVATVTVQVDPPGPEVVYDFSLNTDPGWSTQGSWAFGQPTGGSGDHGAPDPTSGHTGDNVYGYNLDGGYENSMSETYLTTTALDCTDLTDVELKYWRWLGVETATYDHARVQISTDGTNWSLLWENPSGYGNHVDDGGWTQQTFDISTIADGQPTVYLRWVMGSTDVSWYFCGWNLDDIEIWAVAPAEGCANAGNSGNFCLADLYPNDGDGTWDYRIDGDCVIDISDLGQMLTNYGMTSGATREDGDVYPVGAGDGAVDISDLGELLTQYGDDCN